jgi:hypothetical protein
MELRVYRNLWGTSGSWRDVFTRLDAEGYDGAEIWTPSEVEKSDFIGAAWPAGFEAVPILWLQDSSPEEQLTHFDREWSFWDSRDVRLVNLIVGSDRWPLARTLGFIEKILKRVEGRSPTFSFEIHRSASLFHPSVLDAVLAAFPDIPLTLDLSHFVLVSERLVDPDTDALGRWAENCVHLHTRVGTEETPQVADPRHPESAAYLDAFERWWDMVWSAQRRRGLTVSSLTPEYGGDPYLPRLPVARTPLCDLDELCAWQAARHRSRFGLSTP